MIISISNPEIIAERIRAGQSFRELEHGIDLSVKDHRTMQSIDNDDFVAEVFDLEEDQTLLRFSVKNSSAADNYLLWALPDFCPDTRDGVVAINEWLFKEPDDVNNFEYLDLEFIHEIVEEGFTYRRVKALDTFNCRGSMAQIHTYEDIDPESTRVIIIMEEGMTDEEGNLNESGGLVSVFIGKLIKNNEVEIN